MVTSDILFLQFLFFKQIQKHMTYNFLKCKFAAHQLHLIKTFFFMKEPILRRCWLYNKFDSDTHKGISSYFNIIVFSQSDKADILSELKL